MRLTTSVCPSPLSADAGSGPSVPVTPSSTAISGTAGVVTGPTTSTGPTLRNKFPFAVPAESVASLPPSGFESVGSCVASSSDARGRPLRILTSCRMPQIDPKASLGVLCLFLHLGKQEQFLHGVPLATHSHPACFEVGFRAQVELRLHWQQATIILSVFRLFAAWLACAYLVVSTLREIK